MNFGRYRPCGVATQDASQPCSAPGRQASQGRRIVGPATNAWPSLVLLCSRAVVMGDGTLRCVQALMRSMLGDMQWQWLAERLAEPVDLRRVVSDVRGLQFEGTSCRSGALIAGGLMRGGGVQAQILCIQLFQARSCRCRDQAAWPGAVQGLLA